MGHALANLAFVAVLTSSFALLAFSKYWRAQIAPITDPHCIIRFNYWFFTILHFAGLSQVSGSDCPTFRPILPKISLFWFFQPLFFMPKRCLGENDDILFWIIFWGALFGLKKRTANGAILRLAFQQDCFGIRGNLSPSVLTESERSKAWS